MHGFETVLALLVGVTFLALLARRLDIPTPAVLVAGGLLVALVPGLPAVQFDPQLVFLVFIPPLLYRTSLLASYRDVRANLRPILLLGVGHVLFVTAVVAWVAHLAVPGLPWAAAFALGAVVSPPDVAAATAFLRRLPLPRRLVTILEGESMVNDAAAIVAYRVAVAAAVTGTFSFVHAGLRFLLVGAGGIMVGLAVGWLLGEPRPHALLGLASALQVEDPAGVDRPPAVRRHPRPGGVFLEPDIGRLGENALCALLAGRRGLGTEVMRARSAGEEGREREGERAVEVEQEGGEGHAGS